MKRVPVLLTAVLTHAAEMNVTASKGKVGLA